MTLRALDAGRVVALVPYHRAPPAPELLGALLERVGGVLVVADGTSGDGVPPGAAVDVLRLPVNRGKGHALAAGIHALLARDRPPEAVLVVDADGQHPPELAPRFIAEARTAELVVGDRFGDLSAMPVLRRAANRAASGLMQAVTGARVWRRDTQCGMRLLRGRALYEVAVPGGGYEAETVHLKRCLRAGVRVSWVPIPAIYDGAPSSFRPVRDVLRVAVASLR